MSRSKRGGPRDVTTEAQAAAYLYSQGNDQAKIGTVLGVSQGEVSRLLAFARREGWIQTRCVLPESAVRAVEQLVFTGRNAHPSLIELADLVTEMTLIKHPFRAGVKGQKGIEF